MTEEFVFSNAIRTFQRHPVSLFKRQNFKDI